MTRGNGWWTRLYLLQCQSRCVVMCVLIRTSQCINFVCVLCLCPCHPELQKAADHRDFSVLLAVEGGHTTLALYLIKHGANVYIIQVSSPPPPCPL